MFKHDFVKYEQEGEDYGIYGSYENVYKEIEKRGDQLKFIFDEYIKDLP